MVERFDTYYGSISCKSTGRHIHANGTYVLATDYAKLEAELKDARDGMARLKMGADAIAAERDEWKRRCEAMMQELSLFGKPSHERIHAALAIAEVRDNG